MKDGLFPELPKDVTKLSDEELSALLAEHEEAARLVQENDEEFLAGLSAEDILGQFRAGALAIMALREETQARVTAAENYSTGIAEIAETIKPAEVKAESTEGEGGDEEGEGDGEGDGSGDEEAPPAEATAEVKAESGDGDADGDDNNGEGEGEEGGEAKAETREVALVASGEEESSETATNTKTPAVRVRRALPAPAADRIVVNEPEELAFVASGYVDAPPGTKFKTGAELAEASMRAMKSIGRPAKRPDGREERYLVASLDYSGNYPEERRLTSDFVLNGQKIEKIGSPYFGKDGIAALVASGGFCAPLQPIYTMPLFAVQDRPVRDALPSFTAERGGINVPTPTTMGDATGAITLITADEDALGGTFATKACLDMDCPDYTETAVTIISHCREFGNLNAMAWPEKLRHENELTMAELARVAETYLLDRIKAQSVQVTSGAESLSALSYLVDAITKSAYGMRSRLRMASNSRFVALLPRVALDILLLDTVQTIDGNRFKSAQALQDYLESIYIDVTWYIDSPSTGTSQIADASQDAGAIDAFPDNIQWAMFPQGTFLHLAMPELNLGIVRDSTLNSTNDFQIFGEQFENVARIGPAQAAYWETTDICAVGTFPPAGTARTCD